MPTHRQCKWVLPSWGKCLESQGARPSTPGLNTKKVTSRHSVRKVRKSVKALHQGEACSAAFGGGQGEGRVGLDNGGSLSGSWKNKAKGSATLSSGPALLLARHPSPGFWGCLVHWLSLSCTLPFFNRRAFWFQIYKLGLPLLFPFMFPSWSLKDTLWGGRSQGWGCHHQAKELHTNARTQCWVTGTAT